MIKKIDIAGLQLDNYTVREMLMRVDRRISEKILTTIEEVNMDTLALAESDEEVKQSLEACDYTVIADEGLLRAVSKIMTSFMSFLRGLREMIKKSL